MRLIYVIPENKVESVNSALKRQGYGPNNFSRLVEDGDSYYCDVELKDHEVNIWNTICGVEGHIKPLGQENRVEEVLSELT